MSPNLSEVILLGNVSKWCERLIVVKKKTSNKKNPPLQVMIAESGSVTYWIIVDIP